jgi:WbqC-like protein family
MNSHTVAIIQSSYIPWKGYFDIIHDVDEFIFLDEVQYTVRDWRTRNRIKTSNGSIWLTVPAGSDRNRLIRDVSIDDNSWQEKHWRSIVHSYSRAPYFRQYADFFEEFYRAHAWTNLSEMNRHMTEKIARELLGIRTRFTDSSTYSAQGSKLDKILDLLRRSHADRYISGPSASGYLDRTRFEELGIALVLKDYSGYPEYEQLYPPFEHAVSVIDLVFNTGPHAADFIWNYR